MSGLLAAKETAATIWCSLDLPESALFHLILQGDPDFAIRSSFRLGVAAQTSIGLAGLSVAHFHELRTGVVQDVAVDARHAVISFHNEVWYTVNGKPPAGDLWDPISGVYKTKNGGFVRIHTNFPHHRRGILNILNIPENSTPTRDIVAEALLGWDSIEFETTAALNDMCATALSSVDAWASHPQAKSLRETLPVTLIKIGEAPKRQAGKGAYAYPLEGIRVLDLCRVIAGPVGGKALAAYGADVLLVTSPNLPTLPFLDIETSLGKRTTQLDLKTEADREVLVHLAKGADVFLQGYRPGSLEKLGFGAKDLADMRPDIISANLCAWGWDGPWKNRRGFDSLVQTATGFNMDEGSAYRDFSGSATTELITPRPLPMQAIDHAAGYLLALGINAALCKTITEGGSWEVRVSLAAVGQWIRSLGRLAPADAFGNSKPFPPRGFPLDTEIEKLSILWRQPEESGEHGEMTAVRHTSVLSKTPVKEGLKSVAPMGLHAHKSTWL